MTILNFPSRPHTIITVKRDEVEALAALLGGVVVWGERNHSLTRRESDALTALDWRIPKTPQQIAETLVVTRDRAKQLLNALKRKGYAIRTGHYHSGGWVRCADTHTIECAA